MKPVFWNEILITTFLGPVLRTLVPLKDGGAGSLGLGGSLPGRPLCELLLDSKRRGEFSFVSSAGDLLL